MQAGSKGQSAAEKEENDDKHFDDWQGVSREGDDHHNRNQDEDDDDEDPYDNKNGRDDDDDDGPDGGVMTPIPDASF